MNIKDLYSIFLKSTGVCIDTRKLKKGNLYIALKGENFNGNSFVERAINSGAIAAITDEIKYSNSANDIFEVSDSLIFLQKLSNYHRKQFDIPIVALTGSNGKTTTKELIANALSKKYKVSFTRGNLNNHIGVPLSLLDINSDTEIAIIEMGANHKEEIKSLCEIAQPDYGCITNFGKAHLEGFGGFEGVIKGKSELYDYLRANNKSAFVNLDDSLQVDNSKGIDKITYSFNSNSDYNFEPIETESYASISYNKTAIASRLSGKFNEQNIALAATIALFFKVGIEEIAKAIQDYIPSINRSQELEISGHHVLLDAYNANPSSMEVALRNFASKPGNKTVILGDMFELGETSAQEHKIIADLAESLSFEQVYLVGELFSETLLSKEKMRKFKNRETIIDYLKDHPIESKNILIKGSRGMALEKLVEFI